MPTAVCSVPTCMTAIWKKRTLFCFRLLCVFASSASHSAKEQRLCVVYSYGYRICARSYVYVSLIYILCGNYAIFVLFGTKRLYTQASIPHMHAGFQFDWALLLLLSRGKRARKKKHTTNLQHTALPLATSNAIIFTIHHINVCIENRA